MQPKGGDCYEANARMLTGMAHGRKSPFKQKQIDNGEIKLVNGSPSLTGGPHRGKKFGHAWLESDDTVWDFSNGKEIKMPKELYYVLGKIDKRDNHYYTVNEARMKMVDVGTFGPWDAESPEDEWL